MPTILNLTDGQIELLKELSHGANIALYREGMVRLRDKNHNPIKNIRKDLFEKVKDFVVRDESGLYYFDESKRNEIPAHLLK